ncbi:GNAT family N-acetyltransferase [Subtercola endophyticus]|uniref:GNAT family N-acetyltransferase n=1 Tax=Subtercola endophyticus TaxID=2895559 RepID=UPI001E5BEE92|nr:GNAT family N-acetyltransferase [Subtercola endophyticus]UFS60952.1 GNAT family N-acetyltransferase [Subtercola endophyticus]
MTLHVRATRSDDVAQLLALNNLAVPAVNKLDEPALRAILAEVRFGFTVVDDAEPAGVLGFALTLVSGADYHSENYRWFESRSSDFLYVDRIVVAEGARDAGVGQMLYTTIFDSARSEGVSEVFCEVNLSPPNPGSLRFHHRLGFVEVGQQATKGGAFVVSLLAAPLAAPAEGPVVGSVTEPAAASRDS